MGSLWTVSGKTGTAEMPDNTSRCAMTSDINPLEPEKEVIKAINMYIMI